MSNTSYFEVYTEGRDSFTIDLGKYGQGRSGKHLPTSITLMMTGYRYRPSAPSCALFPPRLIVSAANAFDTSGQAVVTEIGQSARGASICLTARTSDSGSQCVDSASAGFSFVIDVADAGGYPSSLIISVADGSILPQIVGRDAANNNVASSTDATIKALMLAALSTKDHGRLNAISLPVVLGKSFFSATADQTFVEDYHGVGTGDEFFLETHLFGTLSLTRAEIIRSPSIIFSRTSGTAIDWKAGGICYAVIVGAESNMWIGDLLQKGATLSFFYRVHLTPSDETSSLVIQRFDVLIGSVLDPTDASFPATIVTAVMRPYVSLYKCFILPTLAPLINPVVGAKTSLLTEAVVLPVTRNEKSSFAATFSLTHDY